MKFAVVDIETTGPSNKVTEVAVVHVEDGEITGSWSTLVNPREFLPNNIIWLTGITQEMVDDSPLFEDIAEEFLAQTEDRIFVAHSVSFDYGILKAHLSKLHFPFNRKRLCTVRMSRQIIPGYPSYSLGKICTELGIPNPARHRALGDAMATAQLLKHLLKADSGNKIEAALKQLNKESVLPPMLDKNVFRNLPNKTGIYRFHNREGKVVYVGKAIDIKKRIQGHFLEHSVIKGVLKEHITDISYELSGTELLAFLMEACEIKMHFPVFNRAAKYATNSYGIVIYTSREGRKMLGISKKTRYLELRGSFSSLMQTREFLRNMVVEFELCPALSGLQKEHSCINCYSDELCFGSETVEVYNQKVEAALRKSWRLSQRHAYLLNGRTEEEMAFVLIENGAFKGFGFMNEEEFDGGYKSLEKALIARHNFSEIDRILSSPSLMSDIRDVWVLPTENDFFESPKSEINMPKLGLFSTL